MMDVTNLKTLLKTITYDPAVYKLVPVEPSNEILRAPWDNTPYAIRPDEAIDVWDVMLKAVTDQLPGVVEYSGEPCATVIKKGSDRQWMSERLGHLPDGIYSLYTHPTPSQPSAEALKSRIAELEAKLEVDSRHSYDGIDCRNVTIKMLEDQLASQPSAEAIVQAALEAALDAVQNVEINCDASGAAIGSAERRIRAIDKQKIIKEASK